MSKIFICGDIFNGNNPGNFISNEVFDVISNCEIAIFNLEGPIASGLNPILKAGPNLKQHQNTLSTLKKSGFNLALLSNNHIFDYGNLGLETTIASLESNGIEYIGAGKNYEEIFKPLIKDISGKKIGFINACEYHNGAYNNYSKESDFGYLWLNHPDFENLVKETRAKVDLLFVFVHAGLENVKIPLWEWRKKYKLICDCGANFVIGSHPHVPQGIESYNNSKIFYSLGNFYFDYHDKSNETFSLIFDLQNLSEIEFLFTKNINNKVVLSENFGHQEIENLNKFIYSHNSFHDIYKIAPEIFEKIKVDYLLAFFSLDLKINILHILKIIYMKWFISKNKFQYLTKLRHHFFENETYRIVMGSFYKKNIN